MPEQPAHEVEDARYFPKLGSAFLTRSSAAGLIGGMATGSGLLTCVCTLNGKMPIQCLVCYVPTLVFGGSSGSIGLGSSDSVVLQSTVNGPSQIGHIPCSAFGSRLQASRIGGHFHHQARRCSWSPVVPGSGREE